MKRCHNLDEETINTEYDRHILLMGNPNVGKSVFFSSLTGLDALSSNYPGTTVTVSRGELIKDSRTDRRANNQGQEESTLLIDVPGTYSLESEAPAEQVAEELLQSSPDGIIYVLDASNLERNLYLLLQVLSYGIPTVVALNMADLARKRGINIDEKRLSQELGVPVLPTVATTGEGIPELVRETFLAADRTSTAGDSSSSVTEDSSASACCASKPSCAYSEVCGGGGDSGRGLACEEAASAVNDSTANDSTAESSTEKEDAFSRAEKVASRVINQSEEKTDLLEKIDSWSIKPWPGSLMAILVLLLAFGAVVGGGMGLRVTLLLPLLNNVWTPLMESLVSLFMTEGFIYNMLVGEYGILIKGFEWPVALVLPYVLLFYIVLSFLEDSGYLPRLGIMADGLLRKVGLQGGSVIPMFLGYGCAVPAILGTRSRSAKKERTIIATMIVMAVPCVSQTGAFISLLAARSWLAVIFIFALSFAFMGVLGTILHKKLPGEIEPTVAEIPPLLIPNLKAFVKKLWVRVRHFLLEAEIPMILAIGIAALLLETGLMENVGDFARPLVVNWLGMPEEASVALVFGIVRRELAVLPLVEMDLSMLQLIVGSSVALFYMPCISAFGVLSKEFGFKFSMLMAGMSIFVAFLVGGLINYLGQLLVMFI